VAARRGDVVIDYRGGENKALFSDSSVQAGAHRRRGHLDFRGGGEADETETAEHLILVEKERGRSPGGLVL
jgi:hypothetical protein